MQVNPINETKNSRLKNEKIKFLFNETQEKPQMSRKKKSISSTIMQLDERPEITFI